MSLPAYAVVVPAYRAASKISAVVRDLIATLPMAAGRILVVDDGSGDSTGDAARAAGAEVLVHSRNRGKGAALRTGFEAALERGFEVALTVDADGQHPAASACVLLEAGTPGDLVLGIRDLVGANAPRANQFSNGISNFFVSTFAGLKLADTQCGLRRYPIRQTLALAGRAPGYAYEAEIVLLAAAAGIPIVQVPVEVVYPPGKERLTHFDSVRDPARIVRTVATTIVRIRRDKPVLVSAARAARAAMET